MSRARNTDPETSHEAGDRIGAVLTDIQRMVLRAFERKAPEGMTDLDLECVLGTDNKRSTYRTRRSELHKQGLIIDTGIRKHQQGSNRIIWALTGPDYVYAKIIITTLENEVQTIDTKNVREFESFMCETPEAMKNKIIKAAIALSVSKESKNNVATFNLMVEAQHG